MTVTPDDSARLQQLGIVLLVNLALFSTLSVLYGIFIMVFSIAVRTTLRRGLKSRSTLAMFILISINFTGATAFWAAWVAFFAIQIRGALVQNIGMALSERFALANAASATPQLIQQFIDPFMWIVNDTAVIWRAWVLFPEHQWVMVGPIFFLLATFVMMLTSLVTYTMSIISPNTFILLSFCTVALSMATNLLATLLIAYKLWNYRNTTGNLGLKKQQSHVQKVLFLLVESGVFFLGLQLMSLLLSLFAPNSLDTAASYAAVVCNAFYNEFTVMYPALILIIVNKERSMVNTFGFSTVLGSNLNGGAHGNSAELATIGHLVFASSPAPDTKGTVDNEQSLSPKNSVFPGGLGSNNSCLA